MKIPEKYVESLKRQEIEKRNDFTPQEYAHLSNTPIEPTDNSSLLDSVGEFLWNAGEGFVSGSTFGASELAYENEKWEDLSTAAKAGWILGEGGSLMTPTGAFGLLGKGGRLATKGLKANKFITKAGQTTIAKGALKADDYYKAQKISKDTLTDFGTDDNVVRWIKDLNTTGKASVNASSSLTTSSSKILKEAFEKNGIKLTDKELFDLSTDYVTELGKGRYVNDLGEWFARTLKNKGMNEGISGKVSDYLGMAVNDMYLMGVHGLIAGKIDSMNRSGKGFNPLDSEWENDEIIGSLKHSFVASLTFPAIRAIPNVLWSQKSGGSEKLRNGLNALLKSYNNTNYRAIAKKHGDGAVRDIMRLMVSGESKQLMTTSGLARAGWKNSKGRVYDGVDDILKNLDKMPIDEVAFILNNMKKAVSKEFIKNWAPKYAKDLLNPGTLTRMGAGVLAMNNSWMFDDSQLANMDVGEMSAHMFMSAIMTKGRGHWGAKNQATYMADFTPYHNTLSKLGMNVDNVKNKLKFYDRQSDAAAIGAVLHTSQMGSDIIKTVDSLMENAVTKTTGDKGYIHEKHQKTKAILELYDVMKHNSNENHRNLSDQVKNLSEGTLNQLTKHLGDLKFKDGNNISQLQIEGILSRISIEPAKQGLKVYKNMLSELGELYDISVNQEGKVIGRLISDAQGVDKGPAHTVNDLIRTMESLRELEGPLQSRRESLDALVERAVRNNKVKDKDDFLRQTEQIINNHMDILSNEFGGKKIQLHPTDNAFIKHFKTAKSIESAERLADIIEGKSKLEGDRLFTSQLDDVFGLNGDKGRYAESIDVYKRLIKSDKLTKEESKELSRDLDELRSLFELRKEALGGTAKVSVSTKGKLERGQIKPLVDNWRKLTGEFIGEWGSNWTQQMRAMMFNRVMRTSNTDSRQIRIHAMLRNEGLAIIEGGKLVIPSAKAVEEFLKQDYIGGEVPQAEVELFKRAVTTIKNVLGSNAVEKDFMFTDSNKRYLEQVDPEAFIKIYKALGEQNLSDTILNADKVFSNLKSKDMNMQKEIKDVHVEITALQEKLESPNRQADSPLRDVEKIRENLIRLRNKYKSEDAKNEIDEVIDSLDKYADSFRLKGSDIVGTKNELELAEINKRYMEPISRILHRKYEHESQAVDQMQELVVQIQNLAYDGQKGGGITPEIATSLIENLSRKIHNLDIDSKNKSIKPLTEQLNDIAEGGNFRDLYGMIGELRKSIGQSIVMNKDHILHNDVMELTKNAEKERTIHSKHRSVIEILESYNLLGEDGKILEHVKQDILDNPQKAFVTHIRDVISNNPKLTKDQKLSKWDKFLREDAAEIILNQVNSRRISFMTLQGVSPTDRVNSGSSIAKIDNNKTVVEHPNTRWFEQKGLKVVYLNEMVGMETAGRVRNVSIDSMASSPTEIQSMINKAIRFAGKTEDILRQLQGIDPHIKAETLREILNTEKELFVYTRVSPMNKVLFTATKENLRILHKEFDNWYTETRKLFRGGERDVFERVFKDLYENKMDKVENLKRHEVELKLMMPYLDHNGGRSEFKKLIKEMAGTDYDKSKVAKIQANMFKRMLLSDGGTTQPVNSEVVKWSAVNHPDKMIKAFAQKSIDTGKYYGMKDPVYLTAIVKDDIAERDTNHKWNNQGITERDYELTRSKESGQVSDIIKSARNELGKLPSLESSLLDGAKFASKELMAFLMSLKGKYNDAQSFELGGANGAKTIVFATGENQLLGKGYLIYHPEVANKMKVSGVDLAMGETSAKTYDAKHIPHLQQYGTSTLGGDGKLRPSDGFSSITEQNIMAMPTQGIGVSFTSKNAKGLVISPSIFDWQSRSTQKDAIAFMNMKEALSTINTQWSTLHSSDNLAKYLLEIKESQGGGATGKDKAMLNLVFNYGEDVNSPLIQNALRRTLRDNTYQTLKTSVNRDGGEENFLVPNIKGDLTNRVDVKLYSSVDKENLKDSGDLLQRATYRYGGVAINQNTASRKMGVNGNLEGERFIFTSGAGQDVIVEVKGKDFIYIDNFTEKAQNKKFEGEGQREKVITVENSPDLNRAYLDSKKTVEKMLNELKGEVNNNRDMTLGEVVEYLKTMKTSNSFPERGKVNLEIEAFNHAIPAIGHDKVINRVQRILKDMNGLVEMNVYDLRTSLQRDNDGDHLYTHTKLPNELFKQFAKDHGRKDDFRMMDKTPALNERYINFLGVGANGIAGENPNDVGFHKYANKLTSQKNMIGSVIGTRKGLSWLMNLGFSDSKGDLIFKDLISKKNDMSSNEWKWLNKFYDIAQNSVDIHGGILEWMADPVAFRRYLFHGVVPDNIKKTDSVIAKQLISHGESVSIWGDQSPFGGPQHRRIKEMMFDTMLQTVKKASMVTGEAWDAKGSHSPELNELKHGYYKMKNLFENPTDFLASELLYKISKSDIKKQLEQEFLEYFFEGENRVVSDPDYRQNLLKNMRKGKQGLIKPKFKFNYLDGEVKDVAQKAFDISIEGHIMNGLLKNSHFWEPNYDGIQFSQKTKDNIELNNIFSATGSFVKNIERYVATEKMLTGTLDLNNFKKDGYVLDLGFNSNKIVEDGIKGAVGNGILRHMVNKQHDSVYAQLKFAQNEKFPNENKIERLNDRLDNLKGAMSIMDVMISKDMVVENINGWSEGGKGKLNLKHLKKYEEVAVYRIKGDVKVTEKETKQNKIDQYKVDGGSLQYGQLKFVGYYNNKGAIGTGKPLYKFDGYTYFVDRKPKQMVSMTDNEVLYGQKLFKATYDDRYNPKAFVSPQAESQYREDVRNLRNSLSYDYINTMKDSKKHSYSKSELWAVQSAREQGLISEFVNKWVNKNQINGDDPLDSVLRHLIQPQPSNTLFYKGTSGTDQPVYKTNNRLYKQVVQWALNNNKHAWVKQLIRDVQGKDNFSPDISSFERSMQSPYDFTALGSLANSTRSLYNMKLFYSDPHTINRLEQKLVDKRRSKPYNVINTDGNKIEVRNGFGNESWKKWKGSYSENEGKGCK